MEPVEAPPYFRRPTPAVRKLAFAGLAVLDLGLMALGYGVGGVLGLLLGAAMGSTLLTLGVLVNIKYWSGPEADAR